jgi:hypothetical protein
LRLKLRMYVDYIVYLVSLQKKETFILAVDFTAFLVAAYAFKEQWTKNIELSRITFSLLIIFILSGVKFVWDTYKIISDVMKFKQSGKFEKKVKDRISISDLYFELQELIPSEAEERMNFKKIIIENQNDFVFHSNDIDRYLRKTELSIVENKVKGERLRKAIRGNKDILIPFLNQHFSYSLYSDKQFYNEKKLCLSDDIDVTSNEVFYHKGSYFDTYLTNHLSTMQLLAKDSNRVVYDGTTFFPAEYVKELNEFRLSEIKSSLMNNEIGISTLGITSDNYLVIWKQNSHAQSSNDLFVPTGSGSSDIKDIMENSFTRSIINGMERELWEESGKEAIGKTHDLIGKTKILGFFRWVKRGGKPEFVGITKLNVRCSQLDPEVEEVRKPRSKHMWKIDNIEHLRSVIKEILGYQEISVPLYMCLVCLENYLVESPEEVKQLLQLN